MEIDEIKEHLKKSLKPERYKHTLNTADMAQRLAEHLGEDTQKAYLAGLVHDCAKNLSDDELLRCAHRYGLPIDEIMRQAPYLLHGAVGACMARDIFGIKDEDILSAVTWHTTGRENMTMLDKIIFMADLTEVSRTYADCDEIRKTEFVDFDKALMMAYDGIIAFILKQGSLLHADTIKARNYLILERNCRQKIRIKDICEPY